MKLLILICLIVACFADSGYYNVISYCNSNSCPATVSEQQTFMYCPKQGSSQAYWVRDSSYNIQLVINTAGVYPYPDSKVILQFNTYSNWNPSLNVELIPTYTTGYYYYMLPCSVSFTSFQTQYFVSYCYAGSVYDSNKVFMSKGYYVSSSSFTVLGACYFVLSDV